MNVNNPNTMNVSSTATIVKQTFSTKYPTSITSCPSSPQKIVCSHLLRHSSSDSSLDKQNQKQSKRKSCPKRSIHQITDSDKRFLEGIIVLDVYSVYKNNPKDLLPIVLTTPTPAPSARKKVKLNHNNNNNNNNNSNNSNNGCIGLGELPGPSGHFDFSAFQNTKGAPDVIWKKGGILNISPETEMYDQLTPEEIRISSTLRVLPAQYLHIKETILTQVHRRGPFKKRDAKSWFRIDVNKTAILFDWFRALGWIPPDEDWEKK